MVAGGSPTLDSSEDVVVPHMRREYKSMSALGSRPPTTSRAQLVRQNSAALLLLDQRGAFDESMSPAGLKSLRRQGSLGKISSQPPQKTAKQASLLLRKSSAMNLEINERINKFLQDDDAIHVSVGVELFYVSGWKTPHIHHTADVTSSVWTVSPGVPMAKCGSDEVERLGLPKATTVWKFIRPNHESMKFVPNDGGRQWDNAPGKQNYSIGEPGKFILSQGQLTEILDPPGTPAVPNISSTSGATATISWSPPIESPIESKIISGYVIYRDDIEVGRTGELTFSDSGLSALTSYQYSVAAFNKNKIIGSRSDDIVVRTTEPGRPSQPRDLRVSFHCRSSIEITFRPPAEDGGAPIGTYNIYRDGKCHGMHTTTGREWERFVDDIEIIANQSYAYCVTAVNKVTITETNFVCESEESEMITGIARTQLPQPRLGDGQSHIILQAFNWRSANNKAGWWKILNDKVDVFKEAKFSMIWLPPPSQSVAIQGYMPSKLYNLNSSYGTIEELKILILALKENGIHSMLDFVANHRCGTKQDKNGHWTVFEDPDWGSWAIVSNNKQGYGGSGAVDTGAQSECAPDLDHTNNKVRLDLKLWTKWLFEEVGFSAFRIDMAPGYGCKYQVEYMENVGGPFSVGEYWSGDVNCLQNYISGCRGRIGAFDFAFYYPLRRCIESGSYFELNNNGRLNGLVGRDPERTVTFLDNHDTEHLAFVGKFAGGDQTKVLRGYAVLLTAPGTPCVYWNHFSDGGPEMTRKLTELCNARVAAGIHSKSGYFIAQADNFVFAAYASRSDRCSHGGGNLAVCVGGRGWAPSGSNWTKSTAGDGYCVWIR